MGGSGIGMLLISAATGYWVLLHAAKEKAYQLKQIGRILGVLIIAVSVLGTACGLYRQAMMCQMYGKMYCPPGNACPFLKKVARPMPAASVSSGQTR